MIVPKQILEKREAKFKEIENAIDCMLEKKYVPGKPCEISINLDVGQDWKNRIKEIYEGSDAWKEVEVIVDKYSGGWVYSLIFHDYFESQKRSNSKSTDYVAQMAMTAAMCAGAV